MSKITFGMSWTFTPMTSLPLDPFDLKICLISLHQTESVFQWNNDDASMHNPAYCVPQPLPICCLPFATTHTVHLPNCFHAFLLLPKMIATKQKEVEQSCVPMLSKKFKLEKKQTKQKSSSIQDVGYHAAQCITIMLIHFQWDLRYRQKHVQTHP